MRMRTAGLVVVLLWAGAAAAADMPDYRPPAEPVPFTNWSGLYLGVHIGGGVGLSQFSDPRGPGIYGGTVRTPTALAGGQAGYNWQVPNTPWVLGAEVDASSLGDNGTGTCLASSGTFISANCRVRQDMTASMTGRIGYAAGPTGRTLLYAKGGMAWLSQRLDIANIIYAPTATTSLEDSRWGWTVGAGVEQAVTPAWSVRLEYDYADFGSNVMGTPASYVQTAYPSGYTPTPGATTSVRQINQAVKLGLSHKFGEESNARWIDDASPLQLRGVAGHPEVPEADIEVGARAWVSSGRFQKDLGATTNPNQQNVLISRLTYDTNAVSGEVFGRADTSSDIFLKGFVGGGGLTSGKMNDEDWLIFGESVPYSNSVSNPVNGSIAYATLDSGYDFLRGYSYKLGGFVGYNYYRENKSAFGCVQIANSNSDCVPSIPNTTLSITENDQWQSFRLGLNGVFMLTDRLRLTADAAYLPYVRFTGTDVHLLRTDVANQVSQESGDGRGVQLEAALSYALANSWSIGAGGRYWAMWTTNNAIDNNFSRGCPCQTLPAHTERYGAFVEASYHIDGVK